MCEESPDWHPTGGGRPGHRGGRPGPGPVRPPLPSRGFWSLLDGRKLRSALISLCNPDMWAFLPYFLITPLQKQINNKTRGILSDQTLILGVGCILVLSLVYLIIKIDT